MQVGGKINNGQLSSPLYIRIYTHLVMYKLFRYFGYLVYYICDKYQIVFRIN